MALVRNPALSARLQGLFPPGTDLQLAAAGFRNPGQFVAAAHVSRNLDIPFDQLKNRMTGPDPMSLGQSIQDLKPNISRTEAREQVKRAERMAKQDIEQIRNQQDKEPGTKIAETQAAKP